LGKEEGCAESISFTLLNWVVRDDLLVLFKEKLLFKEKDGNICF